MIKKDTLQQIIGGGVSMNGNFLSALKGYVNIIFTIGQAVGSAIRRISRVELCSY